MKQLPTRTSFPNSTDEIALLFSDVQLEYVHCEICDGYHPPEIHLRPTTTFDHIDPQDA